MKKNYPLALHQVQEEDPTVIVEVSQELRQTIIHCQGELHLSVIKWKLEHISKELNVKFTKPRIPYRETIRKSVQSNYRHKKQSGGAGQFGEVYMQVEPWYEGMPDPKGFSVRGRDEYKLDWGGKLVFLNCIVGGAIDHAFSSIDPERGHGKNAQRSADGILCTRCAGMRVRWKDASGGFQ